jgi:hypothetical protein
VRRVRRRRPGRTRARRTGGHAMTSAFYDLAAVARPVAVSLSTMGGQGSKITRDSSGGERFVLAKGRERVVPKNSVSLIASRVGQGSFGLPTKRADSPRSRRRASTPTGRPFHGGAVQPKAVRAGGSFTSVWSAACARRRHHRE